MLSNYADSAQARLLDEALERPRVPRPVIRELSMAEQQKLSLERYAARQQFEVRARANVMRAVAQMSEAFSRRADASQ
jgi:hypothetical protein